MKSTQKTITSIPWHFNWERRMTYQKMRLFSYAYQNDIPKIFDVVLTAELYRVKELVVSECHDPLEYKNALLKIEEKLSNKELAPDLFDQLIKEIQSFETDFDPAITAMPVEYSSYENKDLAKAYEEFCDVEKRISFANWILFTTFEEIITKILKTALEERFKNLDKVNKMLSDMSLPEKMIPLDVYNQHIYEIALKPKDEQPALIDRCVEKFIHWGMFDVLYQEATRDSFVSKVKDIGSLDLDKLIKEIKHKYIETSEKQKIIREALNDDIYISKLFNLYSHYANFKDWKNYYREKSSYKLKILLTEIAKRTDYSLEQVSFLTEEETIGILNSNTELSIEEINKRIKNSAYIFLNKELKIIVDENTLNKLDEILAHKNIFEIKGSAGYPGKIQGIARIVLGNDDFEKLLPNEILVTGTTRPDFVPIMERAAGFVTNEGGLLSHAAIVAREMKKPCVIGTKIATQVIKDGDIIEVDANNGVIRIIK